MPEYQGLPDFSDLHILVIGDIMIDRYLHGKVSRISPEAPVPVVDFLYEEDRPGGAANVAVNLQALGAEVTLASITGQDAESETLSSLLREAGIQKFIHRKYDGRHTTVKTRVMTGFQHLLRIDKENKNYLDEYESQDFIDLIMQEIHTNKPDGIILQDYNKGLLTQKLIRTILLTADNLGIPTFVDPKKTNFFEYASCTVFKPNRKEISEALQRQVGNLDSLIEADTELRKQLHHKLSFITLSGDGIFVSDGRHHKIVPTVQRSIADVCGAGDTVLSVIALCYLKGIPVEEVAFIANIAGGQVCARPGVVPVSLTELKNELNRHK
ncbi:MAG: carbohydrate kinase [Saprospiraceae bacterium]|nr:carbohydrate kinase [Saprospiraceae bacterium]